MQKFENLGNVLSHIALDTTGYTVSSIINPVRKSTSKLPIMAQTIKKRDAVLVKEIPSQYLSSPTSRFSMPLSL